MRRRRVVLTLLGIFLAGGSALLLAWGFDRLPDWSARAEGVGPPLVGPDDHYSNILPNDYVGPGKCAKCHEAQHELWSKHPHRFMNQWAGPASVKGDFSGAVWEPRPGHPVVFSTVDGEYRMTVRRPGSKDTVSKVTRTVGSRFVQFYIGVQLEGDEPRSDERYATEHKLPFGYWLRLKSTRSSAGFAASPCPRITEM